METVDLVVAQMATQIILVVEQELNLLNQVIVELTVLDLKVEMHLQELCQVVEELVVEEELEALVVMVETMLLKVALEKLIQ